MSPRLGGNQGQDAARALSAPIWQECYQTAPRQPKTANNQLQCAARRVNSRPRGRLGRGRRFPFLHQLAPAIPTFDGLSPNQLRALRATLGIAAFHLSSLDGIPCRSNDERGPLQGALEGRQSEFRDSAQSAARLGTQDHSAAGLTPEERRVQADALRRWVLLFL